MNSKDPDWKHSKWAHNDNTTVYQRWCNAMTLIQCYMKYIAWFVRMYGEITPEL